MMKDILKKSSQYKSVESTGQVVLYVAYTGWTPMRPTRYFYMLEYFIFFKTYYLNRKIYRESWVDSRDLAAVN